MACSLSSASAAGRQIVQQRRERGHQRLVEGRFDRLLPQGPDVGEAHAVGREDAGEGMDQHRRHAERIGHQAGVLAAGAAEAVERVAGHVVAALHRDLLDRVGHVLDRDLEETRRDLDRCARVAGGRANLRREGREPRAHRAGVQRLVLAGAEDVREEFRLQLAEHDVAVGDAERPAAPVARRAGIGARRLRPDAIARAVEGADRAAARRHGVDQHHRRAHPHARHQGLEGTLVVAVIVRHVGGRAAHVEGDDPAEAGLARRLHRADDAAGRAAENRVLALEERGVGQPPARLHEHEPRAAQLGGHPLDITAQQRREVGVHDRGVAAADELHQRAGAVAGRYLGEADLARQRRRRLLVRGEAVAVHEDDRHRADAVVASRLHRRPCRRRIQCAEHGAVRHDPLVHLDDPLVEHRGQLDAPREEVGPGLVADAQRVAKTPGGDQQRAVALAFQQRVGRHRRPHLDHVDPGAGDRRADGDAHELADALDRRVAVVGVLREQLARHQRAVGPPSDDIGEGPAPVDPELPARLARCHGPDRQSASAMASPALTGPSLMTAA